MIGLHLQYLQREQGVRELVRPLVGLACSCLQGALYKQSTAYRLSVLSFIFGLYHPMMVAGLQPLAVEDRITARNCIAMRISSSPSSLTIAPINSVEALNNCHDFGRETFPHRSQGELLQLVSFFPFFAFFFYPFSLSFGINRCHPEQQQPSGVNYI